MINSISRFIAGHPKIILILSTLLLIPAAVGYISTFVNYDIMTYLPAEIESVQGEEILDKQFGTAASAFLVVEKTAPKDIVRLKEKIAAVEGVKAVVWVDDIVDITIPQSILPDAITDIFYSQDGESTLIMIEFTETSASTLTMDAVKQIKSILNEHCFLSGMSAILEDTKELADREAPKYIAVAIVLALIALSITMDSWVLPVVLLISLGYAIVYNMGTNIFMSGGISYITQCIAAILQLGVTMDYSVFLMDRFTEEQQSTDDKTLAMSRAIAATFRSLVGSSLTTVFGFLALCFMSFTLGLDIGIVMAKGVVFGVLTVVIVLPAFMLIFYKPVYRFRHKRHIPSFHKLNAFTIKHKKVFAVLLLVLILPAYVFKSLVPLNYNVAAAMPEQLDSVQSLEKLKSSFNMATTHFVIIDEDVPSGQVSKMVYEIENVEGISNVISLSSFVGPAISSKVLPEQVRSIAFSSGYQMMMLNSVYTSSTDELNAQLDTLTGIIKKYDPNGYITGEGAMSKDLINVTDRDFKVTSIISIGAIFLLIAILFKSISVPVLLVLSIELAIFINEGIPLITGADVLFVAPTIISCVQLGATVDYAILLTTRFREELKTGKSRAEAMQIAADASDKSIFQSALVFFSATFGVYLICNIEVVSSICGMLARGAAISALVIILFLTPALVFFEKLIDKTSYKWKTNKKGDENPMKEENKKSPKAVTAKRITALALAVLMLAGLASCGKTESEEKEKAMPETVSEQPVYTGKAGSVSKSETVYVNIDNSGAVSGVEVTDWLHTDRGEVCVDDVSDLKDITDIKGDTEPVADGENLQWNMTETDLYYSGKTDKALPVSIDISYYLNGEKISADKLAGRDGKVKIEIDMKNHFKKTVDIQGVKKELYLPVLVVGGMILPENDFSGIKVQNGRSIGDGTKEIVVFYGLPGLSESLGFDEFGLTDISGLSLGSSASVTADAKNFTLGNMYFAAIPVASLNIDLDSGDGVGDLKSALAILEKIEDAITELEPDKLISMLNGSKGGVSELMSTITDAVELYNSNKALLEVLRKYASPENSAQLKQLLEFVTSEDTVKAISLLTDSSVTKFLAGLSSFGDSLPLLNSLAADLGSEEVRKAIENLPDTLEKLTELQKTLDENSQLVDELLGLLSDDKIGAISDILSMLDGDDFRSLEEKYSDIALNIDNIALRCEKWIKVGRDYGIFTKCPEGAESSVMFIYMTPSISKEPQNTQSTQSASGESILDSFIKKFR